MENNNSEFYIDFAKKMKFSLYISTIFTFISLLYLFLHGLNLGVDFTGGTILQIKFKNSIKTNINQIRNSLISNHLENSFIQQLGDFHNNEFLFKIDIKNNSENISTISNNISKSLLSLYGKESFEIRKIESIGPKAGSELKYKGFSALIIAWLGMFIYITWRYNAYFAVSGLIALLHDLIVTVALFTFLKKEINLTIIAAILTIIGYSINDTIVVFDRIRENLKLNTKKNFNFNEIVNYSINQTLNRTLLTSLTVLLVLIALFFWGGLVIHDFSFILLIGVIIGTYSSIFIASALLLSFVYILDKKEKFFIQ